MIDDRAPITDVFPWPHGLGFHGAELWWQQVLTRDEDSKLDLLMGLALLDPYVGAALLRHDENILIPFQFSETTQTELLHIQATTIEEFAQALTTNTDK